MKEQSTPQAQRDPGKQLIDWIVKNQRAAMGIAAAVAAAVLIGWFVLEYQQRKEAAAMAALNEARVALQSGNLPLAASDLSRIVGTYGGTVSADEAAILLAQVRLEQGQPTVAADELRAALAGGMRSQFRAGAYGLLGTSLEEIGNHREAAEAFRQASETSWYDYVAAQYLNDAGRAFVAAQDTTSAMAAFERILSDYEEAPAAMEARVRLAELRASTGS